MEMQELVSPPDRGNDPDSQAALAEAVQSLEQWLSFFLSLLCFLESCSVSGHGRRDVMKKHDLSFTSNPYQQVLPGAP